MVQKRYKSEKKRARGSARKRDREQELERAKVRD